MFLGKIFSLREAVHAIPKGREGETLDLHVDISRFGGRFFSLRPITIQSRCRAGERERGMERGVRDRETHIQTERQSTHSQKGVSEKPCEKLPQNM